MRRARVSSLLVLLVTGLAPVAAVAQMAAAEGDLEGAVRMARKAAELEASLPVDFGPPVSFKPPRELEGELLLEAGRPAEALSAFRIQLERTPRRARTLDGLAAAAEGAGQAELAAQARAELSTITVGGR